MMKKGEAAERPKKREKEREREREYSSPRKPQNVGGPHGPGSLTSSSNPKEEERERDREMKIERARE